MKRSSMPCPMPIACNWPQPSLDNLVQLLELWMEKKLQVLGAYEPGGDELQAVGRGPAPAHGGAPPACSLLSPTRRASTTWSTWQAGSCARCGARRTRQAREPNARRGRRGTLARPRRHYSGEGRRSAAPHGKPAFRTGPEVLRLVVARVWTGTGRAPEGRST